MTVQIRPAERSDLFEIERLLEQVSLTTAEIADHLDGFEIAESAGNIIGCAGLELHGRGALLRSVAVDPAHRNGGIARMLIENLLDRARRSGIRSVYLLTETAADYFRRIGFEEIDRSKVDESVRQSVEFTTGCCKTATVMQLRFED